eukprot:1004766-Amphidinium_carterae.1
MERSGVDVGNTVIMKDKTPKDYLYSRYLQNIVLARKHNERSRGQRMERLGWSGRQWTEEIVSHDLLNFFNLFNLFKPEQGYTKETLYSLECSHGCDLGLVL